MDNLENFLDTIAWGMILSEEYENRSDVSRVISQKIEVGSKNLRTLTTMLQSDNQLVDDIFGFLLKEWKNKPVQEIEKIISIFCYLDKEKPSPYIIQKLHFLANTPAEQKDPSDLFEKPPSQETTGGWFVNIAAVRCISHFYNSDANQSEAHECLIELLNNKKQGVARASLNGMTNIKNPSPDLIHHVNELANDLEVARKLLAKWGLKTP